MKKLTLNFSALACLALLPLMAQASSLVLTVTADSTFAGYDGFIVQEVFTEDGFPPETGDVALFSENGHVRLYGFRELGGEWDILPITAYLVKLNNMNVGDTWAAIPNEFYGPMTSTVEAIESVAVEAGTFNNAYRVSMRADFLGPLSPPLEEFWFVDGVGFVLDKG